MISLEVPHRAFRLRAETAVGTKSGQRVSRVYKRQLQNDYIGATISIFYYAFIIISGF